MHFLLKVGNHKRLFSPKEVHQHFALAMIIAKCTLSTVRKSMTLAGFLFHFLQSSYMELVDMMHGYRASNQGKIVFPVAMPEHMRRSNSYQHTNYIKSHGNMLTLSNWITCTTHNLYLSAVWLSVLFNDICVFFLIIIYLFLWYLFLQFIWQGRYQIILITQLYLHASNRANNGISFIFKIMAEEQILNIIAIQSNNKH